MLRWHFATPSISHSTRRSGATIGFGWPNITIFRASPARQRTHCSAVGSPETVRRRLLKLLEQTRADEIIATAQIYDHTARLHSFEFAAEVFREINESSTEMRGMAECNRWS